MIRVVRDNLPNEMIDFDKRTGGPGSLGGFTGVIATAIANAT